MSGTHCHGENVPQVANLPLFQVNNLGYIHTGDNTRLRRTNK